MSSDSRLMELERLAATGDPEAQEKLIQHRNRMFGPRTIVHGWEGQWVYIEVGPNYGECGVLKEVYLDEVGRGIIVLNKVRRKDDENDNGPTWLNGRAFDEMRYPTTDVTCACTALSRWGTGFRPW